MHAGERGLKEPRNDGIRKNDEGNLTKSFDGLGALDFSTAIAGPHGTRMFADIGAETIMIESADGKTMRGCHQPAGSR
jgi:crotonobetainyl-CoA:carnitine CoA-transferase CaiB-like acyl-CoA transferase